jgi:hypothetical protein
LLELTVVEMHAYFHHISRRMLTSRVTWARSIANQEKAESQGGKIPARRQSDT